MNKQRQAALLWTAAANRKPNSAVCRADMRHADVDGAKVRRKTFLGIGFSMALFMGGSLKRHPTGACPDSREGIGGVAVTTLKLRVNDAFVVGVSRDAHHESR